MLDFVFSVFGETNKMTSQTASLFSYRELRITMTSFREEEILVIFMICGFAVFHVLLHVVFIN